MAARERLAERPEAALKSQVEVLKVEKVGRLRLATTTLTVANCVQTRQFV